MMRLLLYRALFAVPVILAPARMAAEESRRPEFRRFSREAVEAFSRMPIQDGGRIKPLDTYARFMLLRLHGTRTLSIRTGNGAQKVPAIEWLMACIVFPEEAIHYPTFRVDNQAVVVAIGVDPHETRRERYSFDELYPARDDLYRLGREYDTIERSLRTAHQSMISKLAHDVSDFEFLLNAFASGREQFSLSKNIFPFAPEGDEPIRTSEFLRLLPEIRSFVNQLQENEEADDEPIAALAQAFRSFEFLVKTGVLLHLFPSSDLENPAWNSTSDLLSLGMLSGKEAPAEASYINMIEHLLDARYDEAHFTEISGKFSQALAKAATVRGEYRKVGLEMAFYRRQLFTWSLSAFVLSFIFIALSWLGSDNSKRKSLPQTGPKLSMSRALTLISRVFIAAAIATLISGIVVRCVIRGRPPVSTLYETILFITAVSVIVLMIIEWMNRRGVAASLAPLLGAMGLFLAAKYEAREAVDTMPSLQAVLDTNFWLSTHVTCVTIGYSAGLIAGAIAHLYILGRAFRVRPDNTEFYSTVGRMIYGVVCFGLLFSFIGTMLGGIWANYSWGRFWGWDPKENGALMIVLWQLIILHARMGGYVRDFGVCMLAVVGGCIVSFSWWGVNLLGVGLHSYGFTHGIFGSLLLFWAIEAVVLLLGAISVRRLRLRQA